MTPERPDDSDERDLAYLADQAAGRGRPSYELEAERIAEQADPLTTELFEKVTRPEPPRVPYPLDVWPPQVREFFTQIAVATTTDPAMAGTYGLTFLGALIGNSREIQVSTTWKERARIWSIIIAGPGNRKSPVAGSVFRPTDRIHDRLHDLWQSMHDQWDNDPDRSGCGPEPQKMAFRINKATVEGLRRPLMTHPRSTFLYPDELSGWLNSFNQHKGGKGDDRQMYLSMWQGEQLHIQLVKEQFDIRAPFVSITGSTQPHVIESFLTDPDGLPARFLMCAPAEHEEDVDADEAEPIVLERWADLCMRLYDLEEASPGVPHGLEFTPEGKDAFKVARRPYAAVQADQDEPIPIRELAGKAGAYLARISIVLAEVDWVLGFGDEKVTPEVVVRAAALCDYYLSEARRIHGGEVGGQAHMYQHMSPLLAAELVKFVRKETLRKGGPITLSHVTRSGPRVFRDKVQWKDLLVAVQDLGSRGHLQVTEQVLQNGGRTSYLIDIPGGTL